MLAMLEPARAAFCSPPPKCSVLVSADVVLPAAVDRKVKRVAQVFPSAHHLADNVTLALVALQSILVGGHIPCLVLSSLFFTVGKALLGS